MTILQAILFVPFLFNFFLAPVAQFVDLLWFQFVMRGEKCSYARKVQKFKYGSSGKIYTLTYSWDGSDTFASWIFLDGIVCGLISIGLAMAADATIGVDAIISPFWLLVPVSPFIARFVVDVCRNLKLEKGDSKRIRELEERVAKFEK